MTARRCPDIVMIVADDLGYADLSCFDQTDFETPHLDRMAREGVRFTQAYANAPLCTNTRVALITGRYPYRFTLGLTEPLRHLTPPTLAGAATAVHDRLFGLVDFVLDQGSGLSRVG